MENEEKTNEVTSESTTTEVKEEAPVAATTTETTAQAPKNNSKIVIILLVGLLIIAGVVIAILLINRDKKDDKTTTTTTTEAVKETVTITFNSNGGDPIDAMEVKVGEKVTLPKAKATGKVFVNWTDDEDVIYNETTTFEKETKLTAIWKDEEAKTMKITFDSKGGSKVAAQSYVCKDDGATIKSFPKAPTKEGYTFRAWEDKNGKAILEGALLTCKDLTLYAAWDKKEEPTPTPTVEYTCPDGYTLKDTNKCVMEVSKETTCDNGWKLFNGECVNMSSPNPAGKRGCPKINLSGYGEVEGTYYSAGAGYCLYVELTSYKGNKTGCDNASGEHMWFNPNSGCYRKYTINQYTTVCENDEKKFGNQELAPGNGGGCYQVKAAKKTCPTGTTESGDKCIKTIDATKK